MLSYIPKHIFPHMNPFIFKKSVDILNIKELNKYLYNHYKYININHPLYNTFCIYSGETQPLFDEWIYQNEFIISSKLGYSNQILHINDIHNFIVFNSLCKYQKYYPLIYYDTTYHIEKFKLHYLNTINIDTNGK